MDACYPACGAASLGGVSEVRKDLPVISRFGEPNSRLDGAKFPISRTTGIVMQAADSEASFEAKQRSERRFWRFFPIRRE
jgi:hypothetical protein